MVYLPAWLQQDSGLRPILCLALHTKNLLRALPRPRSGFFYSPPKAGFFCGARVKKALTIIQLAIVSGIIIYGTLSLYRGDFEGAYITFPFLLFYYVWIVGRRRRRSLKETDNHMNP